MNPGYVIIIELPRIQNFGCRERAHTHKVDANYRGSSHSLSQFEDTVHHHPLKNMTIYRSFKEYFKTPMPASTAVFFFPSILDIYIDLSLKLIHVGVKLNPHYIWYVLT